MKLVRDNIPKLDKTGKFKYRRAELSEILQLLANKLREEVEELISTPCLDEYVDVADVFAQFALAHNLIGTQNQLYQVMEYTKAKHERNGQFREFWVQELADEVSIQ